MKTLRGRFIPGQTPYEVQIVSDSGEINTVYFPSFSAIRQQIPEAGERLTEDMLNHPWSWCEVNP